VFRELLQNSDDAQSSAVELHFETEEHLQRKNNGDALQLEANVRFPNLKATQVRPFRYYGLSTLVHLSLQVAQWTFRNNGRIFRDDDWNRLRKIGT
jgi:hypothetical protein